MTVVAGLVLLVLVPVVAAAPRVITEDETLLSNSPTVSSVAPQIAVTDDGTVHVVWQEGVKGLDTSEPVIMHRFRSPGGQWSMPTEIYWDGAQPTIAAAGSTVGVAFVRNPFDRYDTTEILYKIWDSAEQQWPDLAQSIEGDIALAGAQPDLIFDRFHGYLWLVWLSSQDVENRPYYARILVDDGQVESAGPVDEREQGAQGPTVAIDAENDVHVCWSTGYASGEADINCWQWPEGGTFWLSSESGQYDQIRQARAPDIDVSTEVLCVTWHEGSLSQPNEIILMCDKPTGNIWFGNISRTGGDRSLLPSITLDEQRGAMVLWRERRRSEPQQILFSQGLPPLPPGAEVTDGSAEQVDMPDLAYRDSYAYAVWVEDTASGGSDVRYARWSVALPTPTPTATFTATATRTAIPTHTATTSPTATPRPGTATATAPTTTPPEHQIHLPRLDKGLGG